MLNSVRAAHIPYNIMGSYHDRLHPDSCRPPSDMCFFFFNSAETKKKEKEKDDRSEKGAGTDGRPTGM